MYGWKWFLALGQISERLMLELQGMHDCGYVHVKNLVAFINLDMDLLSWKHPMYQRETLLYQQQH